MSTINMHMKFEIEIPKETRLMLRKPCRLQTDGRTDGQTDRQGESNIPPPTSLGVGIIRQTLRPNNVSKYQCSLNTWNKAISKRGCSLLMQSQSEAQFVLMTKESTYFNRKETPSMLPERALRVVMEIYLFSMSVSIHDEVINKLQSADWIFVILTYGTWMSIIYLPLSSFYLIYNAIKMKTLMIPSFSFASINYLEFGLKDKFHPND